MELFESLKGQEHFFFTNDDSFLGKLFCKTLLFGALKVKVQAEDRGKNAQNE